MQLSVKENKKVTDLSLLLITVTPLTMIYEGIGRPSTKGHAVNLRMVAQGNRVHKSLSNLCMKLDNYLVFALTTYLFHLFLSSTALFVYKF